MFEFFSYFLSSNLDSKCPSAANKYGSRLYSFAILFISDVYLTGYINVLAVKNAPPTSSIIIPIVIDIIFSYSSSSNYF
ncbi:hypothetical protein [Paraclostridium sordellii]|uniref:hypothetical protein n=1 Tax=Paraclostridium sordellii TaxID=1505 RepID=UPI0021BB68E6|nr:hypothetical protein [Paeniclostridium sordellii]